MRIVELEEECNGKKGEREALRCAPKAITKPLGSLADVTNCGCSSNALDRRHQSKRFVCRLELHCAQLTGWKDSKRERLGEREGERSSAKNVKRNALQSVRI